MREPLGIVLSGGGSRGLAHIGVLRAMAEREIFPSRVAGTSAGAIVGALYAAGFSAGEMLKFFQTRNPFRIANVSLTKPGLLDTSKVVEDFEEYFPADSFQALRRPLSIVATDILEGSQRVFEDGPLISAILASCSVPMVFTPTEIEGRLYCDGGIVDNFPVDLIESRCEVSVGVYVNPVRKIERGDLRNSLTVLQRSLEVGMYQAALKKFRHCDVMICPKGLSKFHVFDTKNLAEVEALGYRAALEQMDALEQRLGRGNQSATIE